MNFIEGLLGISPDGGSGTTELICLVAIAIAALSMLAPRYFRRLLTT